MNICKNNLIMKKKNKEENKTNFCETCKTDLRSLANVKYHLDMGHDVQKFDKDPRSKGVRDA